MSAYSNWIEHVRAAGVAAAAQALGMNVGRHGDLAPCPACAAEKREARGWRGPVGMTPDGAGWRCHRCGAGGDALALVAVARLDALPAPGDRDAWAALRRVCQDLGLCSDVSTPRHPVRRNERADGSKPGRANPRPPAAEVAELWAACHAVTSDANVAGWLDSRKLAPALVARTDDARALPAGRLPDWARCCGRPWSAGWRCILPAFDATGALVTLRARWTGAGAAPNGVKAAAASAGPGSAGAAVLACSLGRKMLQTAAIPKASPPGHAPTLVVAEGEPDWLSWRASVAARGETAEDAREPHRAAPPALVLGVWAGAWTADIAARIPDGTRVVVATDADPAGDKYAALIHRTLRGRCDVRRLRPNAQETDHATTH
jgi:hypothetical protein